jgi:CheY-like chemotaxis protein
MSAAMTTILHVEDDPNDTLLFEHACRKAGVVFDLQAVSDGDQAIAYLRGSNGFSDRMKHPIPKLILLDLKMPRVSGFDVLAWLRSDELFKQLPVVVLTSSNHDADVKRAYDLGARSYLVKPVGFEALVELVKTLPDFLVQI